MIFFSGQKWQLGAGIVSKYGYTLNALFWGSVMGLALQKETALSSFFQSKWLVAAGKYSYGMYLLHVPVKVLITKWYKNDLSASNMNYWGVLFAAVTLILSFISYHLLEKKILYYKRIINIK